PYRTALVREASLVWWKSRGRLLQGLGCSTPFPGSGYPEHVRRVRAPFPSGRRSPRWSPGHLDQPRLHAGGWEYMSRAEESTRCVTTATGESGVKYLGLG